MFLGRGEQGILSSFFLNLFMGHLKRMPLHATLRPVIGGLCFHLSEEIKSDARQMPNIVSTMICLLEFPLAINQFAEMFLVL